MQEILSGPSSEFEFKSGCFSATVEGVNKEAKNERAIPELLMNIETLIKFDEMELARGLMSRALALDSKNTNALKKLSSVIGDANQDIQLKIQQEICRNDNCFETVMALGHLYYKRGEDKKALEIYYNALNSVVDEVQGLFEIYKNIGNILTREGDFDGAEENFNKAFNINPKSDVLAVNLGTLAIQQQNYELALERLRTAVELNPKNDKAWVGLALVHNQMGDHELAFGNIEKAVDINFKNRTAVQIFASWALRNGRVQSAIENVSQYLSTVDLDEEMSMVLVHLFCQQNQFELALLELERVLLWNPLSETAAQLEFEIKKLITKKRN